MLANRVLMGPTPARISMAAHPVSGSNTTAYTFSGVSIGTAATGRRVLVGVSGSVSSGANTAISGVTLGGNAMTQVGSLNQVDELVVAGLFIIEVAAGTTADIIVTHGEGQVGCGIVVWSVYGLNSSTAVVTALSANQSAPTGTIDVPRGGVAVG